MNRVSFEVSGGYHSDAEAGNSGPMSGGQLPPIYKKPANSRFTAENSQRTRTAAPYVDLTVDVQDDRVSVHSLKMEGGSSVEESPELTLLKRNRLEKKTTVVKRLASVSHELKRLTSVSGGVGGRKPPRPAKLDRTKSAATQALKGLKFISKTDGGAGWSAVEKRFNQITATTGGLLLRTKFGECIGND